MGGSGRPCDGTINRANCERSFKIWLAPNFNITGPCRVIHKNFFRPYNERERFKEEKWEKDVTAAVI